MNLITRPVVPVTSTEVPEPKATEDIDFDRNNGLGDIIVPLLFSPNSEGKWVWAVGPTFTFPTATNDDLGSEKWEAGPAAALIYKKKDVTVGAFGQYW